MTNTRRFSKPVSEPLAQAAMSFASSSLDRRRPSTHRAITREEGGIFPRIASASLARADSIWAAEGFSGSRSSASSRISSLQYRLRRLAYSAAAS